MAASTVLILMKLIFLVFDKRNGVPAASPGDKSYEVPEYSHEFHKHGSTRPVISFG